jgi:hypothetical protein
MPERPWTAINTSSGSSIVDSSWTNEVPLFPDGFESRYLAYRIKIGAGGSPFLGE